jgi:uncharacterized protein (TIGR02391 family)
VSEVDLVIQAATGIAKAARSLTRPREPVPDLPPPTELPTPHKFYGLLINDAELIAATSGLFRDGHYAEAVEEAFKLVNNAVKRKAGNPKNARGQALDGVDMMHQVFNRDAPILKINAGKTVSDKDEQEGYHFIFAGAIQGI